MPNNDNTLLETEKEVLRTVQLTDHLADSSENPAEVENTIRDDHDEDETTAALKTSLAETSRGSLHYRHITFLLETRTQQNEEQARREEMRRAISAASFVQGRLCRERNAVAARCQRAPPDTN